MTTEFEELQSQIVEKMKETYSETVIDHIMNPRNAGSIPDADGFSSITGPCGDTMEIWVKVKNGKIADISFWTDGCGTSIACGSIATEMIKGKDVSQAMSISKSKILECLDGLPEENHHCALLAANTIKAALRDYLALENEPWKKAYKKSLKL